MPPKSTDTETPAETRLAEAERKIRELEAELLFERERARYVQQRLATKAGEIRDIHRSRGWALISAIRSLKYRYIDPILGLAGMSWPRRAAAPATIASDDELASLPALRERSDPDVYDVVCFSSADWDFRFQRPQQLMSLFADAGHRVFYVSRQFRSDGPAWLVARKKHNVYEVSFRGKLLNADADRIDDRALELLVEGLDMLCGELSLGPATAIVHLPFWWPLAREARARVGWPGGDAGMGGDSGVCAIRRSMISVEDELLSGADLVTVSSSKLEERALRTRSSVLMLRNACDYDHFAKTPPANNERPVIGYFGAISDWFDSVLVADLAERRPDWDFLLVGSTFGADIARLAKLPNVTLTGEESYESLPEWLGRFDVAIVPFKRTRLTEATNPLKVYEMFAGGRPIVSTPIPEVASLVPLLRLAASAEEFEREITASLVRDESEVEARRAFARENRWESRFALLRSAIAPLLSRASS